MQRGLFFFQLNLSTQPRAMIVWGQNSSPVEAETSGNLGTRDEWGGGTFATTAAVKELWAPSTRACIQPEFVLGKYDFQGNPVMWLTGNGKQLWMSQILVFPVYSNPPEDCFKALRMNKFPFQVSLGFWLQMSFQSTWNRSNITTGSCQWGLGTSGIPAAGCIMRAREQNCKTWLTLLNRKRKNKLFFNKIGNESWKKAVCP